MTTDLIVAISSDPVTIAREANEAGLQGLKVISVELAGGMASLNLEPNNGAPVPCRACRMWTNHCYALYFWLSMAVTVIAALLGERWARG